MRIFVPIMCVISLRNISAMGFLDRPFSYGGCVAYGESSDYRLIEISPDLARLVIRWSCTKRAADRIGWSPSETPGGAQHMVKR